MRTSETTHDESRVQDAELATACVFQVLPLDFLDS